MNFIKVFLETFSQLFNINIMLKYFLLVTTYMFENDPCEQFRSVY